MARDRSEFMIARSSIAFEDFLGSSIAPQVMPPWLWLQLSPSFGRKKRSVFFYLPTFSRTKLFGSLFFFENHKQCDACRTCMLILTMIVMVKALNGVHVRHWWGHYDVKNKLQCSVRWEEGGRAGSEEHIYSGNDWSCVLGIFYN